MFFKFFVFELWLVTFNLKFSNSDFISWTLCMCLGIKIVNRFLIFFLSSICVFPQKISSSEWVLDATQIFLLLNLKFNLFIISLSCSANLRLPIVFIFLTFNFLKKYFVSRFWGYAIDIFLKTFWETFLRLCHLKKVFFVILALSKIKDIFFSSNFLNMLGQISESMKIAKFGFQYSKNLFVKKKWSIG